MIKAQKSPARTLTGATLPYNFGGSVYVSVRYKLTEIL